MKLSSLFLTACTFAAVIVVLPVPQAQAGFRAGHTQNGAAVARGNSGQYGQSGCVSGARYGVVATQAQMVILLPAPVPTATKLVWAVLRTRARVTQALMATPTTTNAKVPTMPKLVRVLTQVVKVAPTTALLTV
jgi:hypothetical protein